MLNIVLLICVAALWGCTNPFLKRGTGDIVKIQADSFVTKFFLEIKYLVTNYKYIIPMSLNQFGSAIYFLILQSADLSLSVPIANSLTFIFTAFAGWMLGEALPKKKALFGMALVVTGTCLCCYDKIR